MDWLEVGPKAKKTRMGEWVYAVCMTYLPLGSMTVEAGLSSAVTPALPMVDVEVELKVYHFSVKLDQSVWVAVHRRWGRERWGERSEGKRGVSLGMG